MPTLETADASLAAVGQFVDPQSREERTGFHVTGLRDARDAISRGKDPNNLDVFRPPWLDNLGALGHIWEDAVIRWMVDKMQVEAKVTAELDGVQANLDGLMWGNSHPLVVESKCRFGSPTEDPRTRRDWMTQTMAYAKMIDTLEVIMPVLYLPGVVFADVAYKNHHLTFTQDEVDRNWASLMEAKRIMERG